MDTTDQAQPNTQVQETIPAVEIPVAAQTQPEVAVVEAPLTQPQESEAANEVPTTSVTEEKKIDLGGPSVEETEETATGDTVLVEQPTGPDQSFNCSNCKGSGLLVSSLNPQGRICADCHGTGKVGQE